MRKSSLGKIIFFAFILSICSIAMAIEATFFQGQRNGRVTGFEKVDVNMFRPQPEKSFYSTENWFHEMQFQKEGIIVIVNAQLHNLGAKKGNIATYITFSDAASGINIDQSYISPEQVKFADQGFGITAGNHSFKLDDNKYYIKYRGKKIQADITYNIIVPSFQQGDGITKFKDGEYVLDNFPIPWADVTATVNFNGKSYNLKGWGSMNHARQMLSPKKFMTSFRAFWMYNSDHTVSIVRSSSFDLNGKWNQRLMVAAPGKILFSSNNYTFESLDPRPVPGASLLCPMRYKVEAAHGDDWLKGEMRVTRIQEKRDIFSDFPPVLKNIAKLFIKESWIYRFWLDYKFDFRIDGISNVLQGKGVGNFVEPVAN